VDATRTRFIDDLAAVATSRHSTRRLWAIRAFAAMNDGEAVALLAAIRSRGDADSRQFIADVDSLAAGNRPARHEKARAALIGWISRTLAEK
jgi:hypothetical protein